MASFFFGTKRVINEYVEDARLIEEAASRQAVFNTGCRFRDFCFVSPSDPTPFYSPVKWSALSPDVAVCQPCFLAAIAPTVLAREFVRRIPPKIEEVVSCHMSDPKIEPAWKAAILQASSQPLAKEWNEHKAHETNLAKCSTDPVTGSSGIGFRILSSQKDSATPFHICELHYQEYVAGTWMENSFQRLHPVYPCTTCDFGKTSALAYLILVLTRRSFNINVFADWTTAMKTHPPSKCKGIIDAGKKKFIFREGNLSSGRQFQLCEANYGALVAPFTFTRPHVQEIPGHLNTIRGTCSLDVNSVSSLIIALMKSAWKGTPTAFLEQTKTLSQPKCPGATTPAKTARVYQSTALPRIFTVCEACFAAHVLPTRFWETFYVVANDGLLESTCDMAIGIVQPLWRETLSDPRMNIFSFKRDLEKIIEESRAPINPAPIPTAAPKLPMFQTSRPAPPTPSYATLAQMREIEQLTTEIMFEHTEAENMMGLANTEYQCGQERQRSGGMVAFFQSGDYQRHSDGHGNWFDNESQAKGSQMCIEAQFKQKEAWDRKRKVLEKRFRLAQLRKAAGLDP